MVITRDYINYSTNYAKPDLEVAVGHSSIGLFNYFYHKAVFCTILVGHTVQFCQYSDNSCSNGITLTEKQSRFGSKI